MGFWRASFSKKVSVSEVKGGQCAYKYIQDSDYCKHVGTVSYYMYYMAL